MTTHQIQDAAKRAAEGLRAVGFEISGGFVTIPEELGLAQNIIASEFMAYASDQPYEPLEIKQTSTPLNKL